MTDENNPQGLSVDDAVELLMQAPETDTPDEDETVDASEAEEVEEGTEEVEAEEAEDQSDEEADETDEAEDEEDEQDEDPVIEWETASGEKHSANLSELQAGYLRHRDYTRKTQEVAETRKALEAKEQAAQEKITQLEEQLAQWAVEARQEPNWLDLAQRLSPQEYNYQRELYAQQKARQEQAREQFTSLRQEEKMRKQAEGAEKLKELIPDLSDADKAPAITNDIVLAAKSLGYTDADLTEIDDPRVFYGLHMVAQFLATQKKQSEVKKVVNKKVAEAKPKLNPGGQSGSKRQKLQKQRDEQMAQLRKTGSIKDAASLLLMG